MAWEHRKTFHPDWDNHYTSYYWTSDIAHYRSGKPKEIKNNYESFRLLCRCVDLYRFLLGFDYWYPSKESFDTMAFEKWTFIQFKLAKEHKKKLEAYIETCKNDVDSVITMFCGDGYKLSVSWVDDRNSYVVTVTPKKGNKKNASFSLPSWSDDWQEAIFMCGFKHEELCEGGDWSELVGQEDSWG